jgi:hypothetical protein
MTMRVIPALAIVLAGGVVVGGCASDMAAPPSELSSSAQLRAGQERSGDWSFRAPDADLARYKRFIIEPAIIYPGPEADFGSASGEELRDYARIITEELRQVLGEKYPLAAQSGPDVARLSVTLLGVEGTVGGVATVTRVIPVGLAVNAVKGVAGGSGSFTGSIEVALEAFDSQSQALVAAGIRRKTPAVFDVEATISTERTVRSAARSFAIEIRDAIDQIQGR